MRVVLIPGETWQFSMTRTTHEVLEDHLRRRAEGRVEEDLAQDYADDVVLLCEHAPMVGREAVRESARRLKLQLPAGSFEYISRHVEGEYAFLRWSGKADGVRLENGADSFVIRDGLIVMQSIYYTVHQVPEG